MLSKVKNIHFIEIGGIGMSSLALILLDRGFHISGSDLRQSDLTEKIKKKGGRVFIGHQPSNIPETTELVVYSSSIPNNNPEIIKAKRKKLPLVHRADVVAELLNSKLGIAVTGA
ncbi:MAG: UDP-N-acetylmuramate--L-alanine ligase, partial [Candidatus Omnitrophica bacterium]|nr:UDP-N-acetylmuramate--L-alanine ligase [Candidatus Omnitrophota bacterium]